MKRTALATIGITLGLAAAAPTALAQSPAETPADFGPPPPAAMQDPGIATPATTDAEAMTPPPATSSEPAPVVVEQAPAAIEEAPAERMDEADAHATTRRAAPDPAAPHDRHGTNPQTGPYLGHGLFNNWGPNDFGA